MGKSSREATLDKEKGPLTLALLFLQPVECSQAFMSPGVTGTDANLPLDTPTSLPTRVPQRGRAIPVVKCGLAGCSCTGRESVLEPESWLGRETVAVAGDDWALERGLCPAWMVGTMGESAKG